MKMKQVNRLAATLALAVVTTTVLAQTPTATPAPAPARTLGSIASHPDWPKAKPEDVSSPEAILKAVYDVISGGKNQPRDWDRFRSLFVPDAHLIPTVTPPAAAGATPHTDPIFLTPDG